MLFAKLCPSFPETTDEEDVCLSKIIQGVFERQVINRYGNSA